MNQDFYDKLLNSAFRFVSYRPRSEKEIRDFLQKKLKTWHIAGKETVQRVLDRLREYHYIDDEAFARFWIENRMRFRPKGSRLLTRELAQKGVGKVVDLGLSNELEAAKKAVSGRLTVWRRLPPLERKKKLFGFLHRRGFSSSIIGRVVDEYFGNSYNISEETEST